MYAEGNVVPIRHRQWSALLQRQQRVAVVSDRLSALLYLLQQVSVQIGEDGADVDALMAKMDRLQTAIDAANGWEIDRHVQRATDALRCPPGECRLNETMQLKRLILVGIQWPRPGSASGTHLLDTLANPNLCDSLHVLHQQPPCVTRVNCRRCPGGAPIRR